MTTDVLARPRRDSYILSAILRALLVSACLVGVSTGQALAASERTAPPAADVEAETEQARAEVTLDGEVLFSVERISVYSAERRAQAIEARIRAVAADRAVAPETLRVVAGDFGANIMAGDRLLLVVVDADARRAGDALPLVAEVFRQTIAHAMTAYRAERTARALGTKSAVALGATVAAVLLLLGIRRLFRWLEAFVERRLTARIHGLEAQSFRLIQARQVSAALGGLVAALRVAGVAAVAYGYLALVLEVFPWSRPLARQLETLFLGPLARMGLAVLDAFPNLIFLTILILVVRYLVKLVRLFFAGVESGTILLANFDREWAWPTYRIVRFLVIAFTVVVAYPYIPGSQSPAFQGVSIFIGIIFSLGSSSFISNLIAGYSMTYRRAFRVGDRIQVGDVTGDITESGLMVTRIRTVKNEEVVVPNSTILSSHIVNYSTRAQQGGLILHTTVGIGYETPWRQVEAMLIMAAERTPGLRKEPPPFVLQKNLGDFCVTYEINAHCDDPQAMARLYTDLHRNILDLFNEYGVQIMTPAYEGDPQQPKLVPKAQWFAAPARSPETQRPTAHGVQP